MITGDYMPYGWTFTAVTCRRPPIHKEQIYLRQNFPSDQATRCVGPDPADIGGIAG
jgi:hypothetical protein